LDSEDIRFIRILILPQSTIGEAGVISQEPYARLGDEFVQPSGNFKVYAARDLLLRLGEQGLLNFLDD
jgi:hypothetical protein